MYRILVGREPIIGRESSTVGGDVRSVGTSASMEGAKEAVIETYSVKVASGGPSRPGPPKASVDQTRNARKALRKSTGRGHPHLNPNP